MPVPVTTVLPFVTATVPVSWKGTSKILPAPSSLVNDVLVPVTVVLPFVNASVPVRFPPERLMALYPEAPTTALPHVVVGAAVKFSPADIVTPLAVVPPYVVVKVRLVSLVMDETV